MNGQIIDSPCDCGVFKSFDKIRIVCSIIPLFLPSVIVELTAAVYLSGFTLFPMNCLILSPRDLLKYILSSFFKKPGLADTT